MVHAPFTFYYGGYDFPRIWLLFSHIVRYGIGAMMMAIIAPPIFSLWRKRAVHGPKDTPGGGFRFPPPGPPLETTQRKGPRPLPLETIPESRGSGSGKRSRGYRQAPTTIDTVRRGPSGIKYGNLRPRPTQKAGIFNRSLFLSQKSVFLFHRARRIFFLQKENGGRICQPSSWLQSTPHSENPNIIHCAPAATAGRNTAAAGGHRPPWPAPPRRRPPE